MSEVGRTSCKVCRATYESADMETPCDKCRPELKKVNEPYVVLFNYCHDQVIMGPNGPVALNMLAVQQAMEDYQIDQDERIEFSYMVRYIAGVIFSAQAEEHAEQMRKLSKKR